MNPLESISGASANSLRQHRDRPAAILEQAARNSAPAARPAQPDSAATPSSDRATAPPTDPGAAEFARYFPGLAGQALQESRVARSQVRPSLNIESEIAVDPQRKRLYEAALDFQGIFISKMLKSMRSNLNPENDMLFGGNRQQIFEDMLYDEYSKAMSRADGFDLADQMYQQLSANLPAVAAGAGESYRTNSHRVSTEELWNEREWRP